MFKQARTTWKNWKKKKKPRKALKNTHTHRRSSIFQTLDIRQHRTMIPERNKWEGAWLLPWLTAWREFPAPVQERGTQMEPGGLLNWGGTFVSSGSPRHLELAEKVLEIVWWRKSSKNLQKVLLESSTQYYSVHMNKETTQNQRKNHLEGIERKKFLEFMWGQKYSPSSE